MYLKKIRRRINKINFQQSNTTIFSPGRLLPANLTWQVTDLARLLGRYFFFFFNYYASAWRLSEKKVLTPYNGKKLTLFSYFFTLIPYICFTTVG
jgi:hypothetical protein